jgi:hypothetical protein
MERYQVNNTNPRAGLTEIKETGTTSMLLYKGMFEREGYVFTILLDLHIKSIFHCI